MNILQAVFLVTRYKLARPTDKQYPALTSHEAWKVALSAPLFGDGYGVTYSRLYPLKRTFKPLAQLPINDDWNIRDAQGALQMCDLMLTEATTAKHVAWHTARLAFLARASFGSGYIDEATAWHYLEEAARLTYPHYNSWKAFADDYIAGRRQWGDTLNPPLPETDQSARAAIVQTMLNSDNTMSPWNNLKWRCLSEPNRSLEPTSGTDKNSVTITYK